MTIELLRDEVVRRGKEAARKSYSRDDQSHKLRGSLAGFDRAAKITLMPEQFEAEIATIEGELMTMRGGLSKVTRGADDSVKDYWERRCYQAEIEWVFSVLCIAWKRGKKYSARAVQVYSDIVGVQDSSN